LKKRVIQSLVGVLNVLMRNSVLVVCFTSFYYFGGELNIQNVYTIWTVFDRIFNTIMHASNCVSWASRIVVAANRLNNYICSDELNGSLVDYDTNKFEILDDAEENAIEVEQGNFYWLHPEQTKYLEKKKAEEKEKEEREKTFWGLLCPKKRKMQKRKLKRKVNSKKSLLKLI